VREQLIGLGGPSQVAIKRSYMLKVFALISYFLASFSLSAPMLLFRNGKGAPAKIYAVNIALDNAGAFTDDLTLQQLCVSFGPLCRHEYWRRLEETENRFLVEKRIGYMWVVGFSIDLFQGLYASHPEFQAATLLRASCQNSDRITQLHLDPLFEGIVFIRSQRFLTNKIKNFQL